MAPSLIAREVRRGTTREELSRELDFWLDLLYHEFFAPRALVKAAQLDAFLDYFERTGVLERCDEQLHATEKGEDYFRFLQEQTQSLLEAYRAAFAAIATVGDLPATARQLEKAAEQHFRRSYLVGEVRRPEGWNPVTFRNALELLVRRRIVEKRAPIGRGEALYTRGETFDELPGLQNRLAAALASR